MKVGSSARDGPSGSLIVTALTLVVLIASALSAGLYLRTRVVSLLHVSETIRSARSSAFGMLRGQLDEETGIRGFVASGNREYLEPYYAALPMVPADASNLRKRIAELGIPEGPALVDRASALNRAWLALAAGTAEGKRPADGGVLQARAKTMVDGFRAAMANLDTALDRRYVAADADLYAAIERTGLLFGGLILLVAAGTILFGTSQNRAARALEASRALSEEQRREAMRLRIAYETEKHIADTLQDGFAQRPLPTHPSLRFSAMYVPAEEENKVGGDWYDALELPGDRVLFVIGDVAGHGIEAAVGMNRARQALMSSALVDTDPADILTRVNAELLRNSAPMVTGVVGYADAQTYEFVYASAGHPPPILIEPGRAPRMLEIGGVPLGVVPSGAFRTRRVQSVPGAILVLYTDGAVEHSRDVIEGERTLLAAIGSIDTDRATEPAAAIHRAVFAGRTAGDDVAILTVGFSVAPSTGMRVSADRANAEFAARSASPQGAIESAQPSLRIIRRKAS